MSTLDTSAVIAVVKAADLAPSVKDATIAALTGRAPAAPVSNVKRRKILVTIESEKYLSRGRDIQPAIESALKALGVKSVSTKSTSLGTKGDGDYHWVAV